MYRMFHSTHKTATTANRAGELRAVAAGYYVAEGEAGGDMDGLTTLSFQTNITGKCSLTLIKKIQNLNKDNIISI